MSALTSAKHYRRNYVLGMINGASFGFVDSIVSPGCVVSGAQVVHAVLSPRVVIGAGAVVGAGAVRWLQERSAGSTAALGPADSGSPEITLASPGSWPTGAPPHQLAIGLGLALAIFTLVSGVMPLITGWHNDNAIHREVFGNVPGPLKVAFYTVIPVLIVWGSFKFADRIRNWERGTPDRRRTNTTNAKRRLRDFRAGVYMQTLLRDPAAGLMHSMIYFGFLVLLGVTTVLEVDHQMPESLKFLHGDVYRGYVFIGDLAGQIERVADLDRLRIRADRFRRIRRRNDNLAALLRIHGAREGQYGETRQS